jgi:hypothetical protein
MFGHPQQQGLPDTDKLFVPLHTGLLEKLEFKMTSVMILKLHAATA